ncbi:hypothetical protein JCM15519_04010 [Fundidesulfovibrio butyratiphilus]
MTLGQRIRQLRGDESQDAFANRLNINKNTLGFYERDERTPNATFVADICKRERISTDWLLYGDGPIRRGEATPDTAQDALDPQPIEDDWKMTDMVTMTVEVLESDTIYRTALASNIRAFHQAVRSERTLAKLEERVAILEAREERWAQIEGRMADLEKENAELKRRLERQDENTAKAVGD